MSGDLIPEEAIGIEDQPIWYGPDLVHEAGLTPVSADVRRRVFEAFDVAALGVREDGD